MFLPQSGQNAESGCKVSIFFWNEQKNLVIRGFFSTFARFFRMIMKNLTLIALLFGAASAFASGLESSFSQAQASGQDSISSKTPYAFAWGASMNVGYLLTDGKTNAQLPDGSLAYPIARPVMGAKLLMEIQPAESEALADWNDASVGVGLDFLNLGNNQWLGHIIAPYTFVSIPLLRLPHFRLGLRPGVGLAFATKTYANTIPEELRYQYLYQKEGQTIANQCIGSVTNFYFAEALWLDFPIRKGWSILASAGWYHVSNGSTIQPNSGYNMLAGEIGIRYEDPAFGHSMDRGNKREKVSRIGPKKHGLYGGKRWDIELSGSGWFRQVYYKDMQTFGVASMGLAAHYRPWAIFKIGGGIDVFYDGAYQPRNTLFGKTELTLATPADCWRVGLSIQPEFVMGDFSVGFHVGAYLLDGVKNLEASNEEERAVLASGERLHKPIFYKYDLLKAGSAGHPDGWLYTRILMKYRPTDHFFVQAGMKAHLTKAEFVDLGVGVCF